MCDPVTGAVVVGGIGAATQAMSAMKQREAAKDEAKLLKRQAAMQEAAAKRAAELDRQALEAKAREKAISAEADKFERIRQAAKEAAAIRLASTEAGVFGTSIFRMLGANTLQTGYDVGIIESNKQAALEQIEREKQAVQATLESRLNESSLLREKAKKVKKSAPSMFESLFMVGSGGISGALSGASLGKELSSFGFGTTASSSSFSSYNANMKAKLGGSI